MSKIFQIKSQSNSRLIQIAKSLLSNDQVIALPTDTVYGLAASVNSSKGIKRLYVIKSRDFNKPFAICVADVPDIYDLAHVTIQKSLLNELLPGAITVLFKRTKNLNAFLNPETDLIGIRIPDNDFVRELCRKAGPLALTSTNLSNQSNCLSINEFEHMWPMIDGIFDGGTLGHIDPKGFGSTIIDFSIPHHYRIIRKGCIYNQTIQIIEKYNLKILE